MFQELVSKTNGLGISDNVIFTGRVPHDEVANYYSVIDIAPFPRKGKRVCELVSPLKPFEALAMGKSVVVSDVEALQEIITDGKTGLIHAKDDSDSLAHCIKKLVLDHKLRDNLSKAGRNWILENRTWDMAGEKIISAYETLSKS